jgi:PAS domain S-box-containing protein
MEQLVETIFTNLPVGLLIIGGDGRILQANPSACHILGCPIEGFVGNRWGEIFLSQQENLEFTQVVLDAIQRETPKIERITPYTAPGGRKRFLSVISTALRTENKISSIVVLIEDLTELNASNQREKDILAQNHRLAAERAESLIAFARSVAHQIRNPIMAIAGFARLLKRRADDATLDPLEAITEETGKLETMVRAVAEFSAIAVRQVVLVNLWVVIEEAKRRIETHRSIFNQGITWKTDCPDMNLMVDRDLMIQAISELMLNSAEFAGPGAEVRLCAGERDGAVTITVTDNGPGFTPEGLELAFDPFFTTKTVGAGMGLTRTKRIIGEHQGAITVANTDQGHARVTIDMPVRRTEMMTAG